MPNYRAAVKYWLSTPGAGSRTRTSRTLFPLKGRTESAVLAELQKKHPGKEIVIVEIEWK